MDDRGLCYGDGLFETALIFQGEPTFWEWRIERLERGLDFLQFDKAWIKEALHADLKEEICELIQANHLNSGLGILKIMITRGVGPRGYGFQSANTPWILIQTIPLPAKTIEDFRKSITPIQIGIHPFPVPDNDPYRKHKLLNKVPSVLAKHYADLQSWDDALIIDQSNRLLESSGGNLFWWENGKLCTPPQELGILDGVTRRRIIQLVEREGWQVRYESPTEQRLMKSGGIAITSSIRGWVNVNFLGTKPIPIPDESIQLNQAYWATLET